MIDAAIGALQQAVNEPSLTLTREIVGFLKDAGVLGIVALILVSLLRTDGWFYTKREHKNVVNLLEKQINDCAMEVERERGMSKEWRDLYLHAREIALRGTGAADEAAQVARKVIDRLASDTRE